EALAPEGVERRTRALEPRARERDEEDAAHRRAEGPDEGAGRDVAAHARRAARAPRDAGPAGTRHGPRGDEPADAPPPREGAAQRKTPLATVAQPGFILVAVVPNRL